jgi:uncharacterized protein DUF4190
LGRGIARDWTIQWHRAVLPFAPHMQQPPQPPPPPPAPYMQQVPMVPRTNNLAIVSLIFGVVAWVLCPIVGAVVAVVTGHRARGEIRTSGEGGEGMALAGLILGYLNLGLVGVSILVIVLILLISVTVNHP